MPCLRSVLRWLMDPRDPSWPCSSYQWASCRKPQGFCHTDTLSSPSQVSCQELFSLKLQFLFVQPSLSTVVLSTFGIASASAWLCRRSLHHEALEQQGFANQQLYFWCLLPVSVVFLTFVITNWSSVYSQSLSQAMAVLKLDLGKQEVHWVGVSSLNLGHKITYFDAVSAGHSTESSGQSGTNGSGVLSSGWESALLIGNATKSYEEKAKLK